MRRSIGPKMSITAETLVEFLLTTTIFRNLTPAELTQVASILQVMEVPGGKCIFEEGEEGDAWYVVYQGEVVVTKKMPLGPSHDIAHLVKGDCFGEMAILDDSPRGAGVSTTLTSILLRFPRGAFEALLESGKLSAYKLVWEMAKVLCQRQRELTQVLADIVDDPGPSSRPDRATLVSLLWTPPVWE